MVSRRSEKLKVLDSQLLWCTMHPTHQQFPRVTQTLRASGSVSSELSRLPVSLDEDAVKKKRRKAITDATSDGRSWNQLTQEVINSCSKVHRPIASA